MRLQLQFEWLSERLVPAALTLPPPESLAFAVGSDVGGDPTVKSYGNQGGFLGQRLAFEADFRGGVKVAVGDVTGDGRNDLVAAAGIGGGPRLRVFDGATGNIVSDFFAYSPTFRGGVNVAVGDMDGDGVAEIVTGAGRGGGSHIRAFRADGTSLWDQFAYDPALTCGVHVAVGDLNGDGRGDLITAAPMGGGPHIRYVRHDGVALHDFFAYAPSFTGGVNIGVGDLNGDGFAEVVTAPGTGGAPHIRVFDQFGTERAAFFTTSANSNFGTAITVTVPPAGENAVIVAGNGPGGDAWLSGLRMNGTRAFSVSAFDHQEGVAFGNGSGFAFSHTEMEEIRLALEVEDNPGWWDDYDLEAVKRALEDDVDEVDGWDDTLTVLNGFGLLGEWW